MLWVKHKTNLQMPQDITFVWVIKATKQKEKIDLLEWKMCMLKDIIHNFGPTLQLKFFLRIHFTSKWQNSNRVIEYCNSD
jgi:hypothetical protein